MSNRHRASPPALHNVPSVNPYDASVQSPFLNVRCKVYRIRGMAMGYLVRSLLTDTNCHTIIFAAMQVWLMISELSSQHVHLADSEWKESTYPANVKLGTQSQTCRKPWLSLISS